MTTPSSITSERHESKVFIEKHREEIDKPFDLKDDSLDDLKLPDEVKKGPYASYWAEDLGGLLFGFNQDSDSGFLPNVSEANEVALEFQRRSFTDVAEMIRAYVLCFAAYPELESSKILEGAINKIASQVKRADQNTGIKMLLEDPNVCGCVYDFLVNNSSLPIAKGIKKIIPIAWLESGDVTRLNAKKAG